ncbi:hypothetical protein SAMN05216330_104465 [Bradyrhizobium sp. Ghvi]|uniref:hypothetical protein n=1 Tax=Bradyrhizobium sp. Ghvi TaxID=1855319 RepID=UPI0008F12237|nr:hypothetical protein [Bradyrhizobium sp. Ghvi]SFO74498.1 hypothetical protein SAMN05216330_104465 [Bradyrhizobium sp. Ghvi]
MAIVRAPVVTASYGATSASDRLNPSKPKVEWCYPTLLHCVSIAHARWLRLDHSRLGDQNMRNLGILAFGAALAGCASSSSDITAAYVSPVMYQNYNCQQLAMEAQGVSARAAALSGAQDSQRTKDVVATTAAVVIFWPAAFLVGGDKQTAAELAQMKGQLAAIEQASIVKKCNIQFQGKPGNETAAAVEPEPPTPPAPPPAPRAKAKPRPQTPVAAAPLQQPAEAAKQ